MVNQFAQLSQIAVIDSDPLAERRSDSMKERSYMHLTGYNLIRGVMAAAAQQAGKSPWEISFKGTLQTLSQFLPLLLASVTTEAWCTALLKAVAAHIVGNRPDRFEPRRIKRRPKHYLRLQKHRRLYTSQDEPNR